MECRRHRSRRRDIQREICRDLGRSGLRTERLLGDPRIIKYTVEYVLQAFSFGAELSILLSPLDDEDDDESDYPRMQALPMASFCI